MEAVEVFNRLIDSKSPLGFGLAVSLFLVLISGFMSKAAADYGGIFGAASRALKKHKEEAIAADQRSDAKRLDRLEETINRLDSEVSALRKKDTIHHEYQLYVAGYWRQLQFWAVEKDSTLR